MNSSPSNSGRPVAVDAVESGCLGAVALGRLGLAGLLLLVAAPNGAAQPEQELLDPSAHLGSSHAYMRQLLKSTAALESDELRYITLEAERSRLKLLLETMDEVEAPPGLPEDLTLVAVSNKRATLKWRGERGSFVTKRVRPNQEAFPQWTIKEVDKSYVVLENSLGETHRVER